MKYSPKVTTSSRGPKLADLHPLQDAHVGGREILKIMWRLELVLKADTGMDRFARNPSAGSPRSTRTSR